MHLLRYMDRYMSPPRENQLKLLVTDDEKQWAEEIAKDAGKSVSDLIRAFIVTAHVAKERREKRMNTQHVKLSYEETWLYQRIQRGGPLGEPLTIERLDHDSRVKFGDEIVFSRGDMLKKLREGGYIRRSDVGQAYEAVQLPERDAARLAFRLAFYEGVEEGMRELDAGRAKRIADVPNRFPVEVDFFKIDDKVWQPFCAEFKEAGRGAALSDKRTGTPELDDSEAHERSQPAFDHHAFRWWAIVNPND
jgi:hypothetical protein